MATKKVCVKCKAPAVDPYALECEYCGGSTFSHVQDESSKETAGFQRVPSVDSRVTTGQSKHNSYDYNPSIIEGLTDTTFTKYMTRKLASFTYQVALFVMVLIIIACVGFVIWGISQHISATVFVGLLLIIALVLLFALIWLASLRLRLESFTALVQISKNTQDSESSS